MKRRYQVGIIVNDAEPHSHSSFSGALTRAQLRALIVAANHGMPRMMSAATVRGAQAAVQTLASLLASAEFSRKQRLAGIAPMRRHRGQS